jgi:chorismate synthase
MSGSSYGSLFKISTFGESHGPCVGAVIDGCPAGLLLSASDIQRDLDRRRPSASSFSTGREEEDECIILSGIFEGKTTGAPIAAVIRNTKQQSGDYEDIKYYYRPGHSDYTYERKYGLRDYRGGGRASGRETAARVIGGAVARKVIDSLGIQVKAYTHSIGSFRVSDDIDLNDRFTNPLVMPDNAAYAKACAYLEELKKTGDSVGGTIKCVVENMPAGIGQPVFHKLDAEIAQAVMSIGAVKGIEFGAGFRAAVLTGSENNDGFESKNGVISKCTNNAGGVLGGISDGGNIEFTVAVKPTPSISLSQKSVNARLENVEKAVHGRFDTVIVPRAVVVVEAMTCIVLCDLLLTNMAARMDNVMKLYARGDDGDCSTTHEQPTE